MNQAHTGSDPVCIFFLLSPSGLEAFLPDGLHAVADIVKDMPPLDAAPFCAFNAQTARHFTNYLYLCHVIDDFACLELQY